MLSVTDSGYGSLRYFNAHAALANEIILRLAKYINRIARFGFFLQSVS